MASRSFSQDEEVEKGSTEPAEKDQNEKIENQSENMEKSADPRWAAGPYF